MRINKFIKIIVACVFVMCAFVIISCSNKNDSTQNTTAKNARNATADKISVVATIFPEYDWVREIAGDTEKIEITLLMQSGVDMHSFQPSVDDMIKIANCNLFIYAGGESDAWVEDALKNARNKNMVVVNLLETLGDMAKKEEIVEGMQEDEHDHDEHAHHDEHDEEEHEEEEHGHGHGAFEDHDVKDRNLSDWEGRWQSAYPLVLNGTLDEVWEHKSEDGEMTAAEYKEHYKAVYKTDIAEITVKGDEIAYKYDDGRTASAKYKYAGYYIRTSDTGNKSVAYRFEVASKNSTSPRFIEFSDHIIEPTKSEHFHIRTSNESFEAISLETSPIFFPFGMADKEIAENLANHGHGGGHEHHHEDEEALDEHVWLSLRNAEFFVNILAEQLGKLDTENAATYKSNADRYIAKLSALDDEYKAAVQNAERDTLLFCDRFPFRYLVDDYGLRYYAAFVGCSAETEASFETVAFLSKKADELLLSNVITIEGTTHKIAETVIANTSGKNQNVLVLDSMQSVNLRDIANGATYISIMQKNLDVLKRALN